MNEHSSSSGRNQLPFFPADLDYAAQRWWTATTRQLSKATHPFLASIKVETIEELPTNDPARNGEASPLYTTLVSSATLSRGPEDALGFDLDKIRADLWAFGQESGDQVEKQMFAHMTAVAESHEMKVDGKDRDFHEALLEVMEKLEFTFDENGNHNVSIMMHPDTYAQIQDKKLTPDQQARLDAIVAKKKEAWNESRRRKPLPRDR